jgi:hypothetical protein
MNDLALSFIRGLTAAPRLYFRPLLPSTRRFRQTGIGDIFEPTAVAAKFYDVLAQMNRSDLQAHRHDVSSILGLMQQWMTERTRVTAGLPQIDVLVARVWNNELGNDELSLRASFAAGFFYALTVTAQRTGVFRTDTDHLSTLVSRMTSALRQKMIPRSAPLLREHTRWADNKRVDTA